MKGGGSNKFRVKNLSLSLIVLLCISFAFWAWDQTEVLTTLLPPDDSDTAFVSSPVISMVSPKTRNAELQSFTTDSQSDSSTEKNISTATKSKESHNQTSELTKEEAKLKMVTSEKKECNYAKGKWVADKRRPLYSGFGCKQWLAEGWSCRLSTRTDFSFENYRWQPNGCEMPQFEGSKFLRRMQNKTVAIVGDSLGRQQFQSLMCMVTSGRDYPKVEDIGDQYGFFMAPGDLRPNGWAYRFPETNTTILYHWSASLCGIEPINQTDPNTNYAMHLDRPAQFIEQSIHKFDVLVLNTGHHWNRGKVNANRWVMYANGKPNTDKNLAKIWVAKELTIRSVVKWLDSQIARTPKLKVFFRTISPRHFANGDWNTGGSCDSTMPLVGGSEVTQNGSGDPVIENAVKGTRVQLLDITALSQLRDEGHISKYKSPQGGYDCLHWCLPGIPDTWNEIVAAQV